MASIVQQVVGKAAKPGVVNHDSSVLDLAFALDCTSSMRSYIDTARMNIQNIVEKIVSSEKSDLRLALVEYRDHPPQENTFVTRPHDFSTSLSTMRKWLERCNAQGGGDIPEAVADALHEVLKLKWRENSTKICVMISDAPPHGLHPKGDSFPNGCPSGHDPMTIVRQMAEKGITLYCVGCEPSIVPYKEFFTAIAFLTGGQYVPLLGAKALTQIIIGGAQEEISLERWMAEVDREVQQEMKDGHEVKEENISKKITAKLRSKGARSKTLMRNSSALKSASAYSKVLSKCISMKQLKGKFELAKSPPPVSCKAREMCKGRKGITAAKGVKRKAAVQVQRGRTRKTAKVAVGDEEEESEVYKAVESTISQSQVLRMVKKCKARIMKK